MNSTIINESKDNKYKGISEVSLDELNLEYNEYKDLYYYDCQCGNEMLILKQKMITEVNLILTCEICKLKTRFINFNHLV